MAANEQGVKPNDQSTDRGNLPLHEIDKPLGKADFTLRSLLSLPREEGYAKLAQANTDKQIGFMDYATYRGRLGYWYEHKEEASKVKSPFEDLLPAALVGAGGAGAIGLYIVDRLKEIVNGTETQFDAQIDAGSLLDKLRAKLNKKKYLIDENPGEGDSVTFDIYEEIGESHISESPLLSIFIADKSIPETVVDLKASYVPGGKTKKSERTVSSVQVSGLDEDVVKGQMKGIVESGIDLIEALTTDASSAGDELADLIQDGQDAAKKAKVMQMVLAIISEEAQSAVEKRALYIQTTGINNETYKTQLNDSDHCGYCSTGRTKQPEEHACISCGTQLKQAVYQGDELTQRRQAAGL